MQPVDPATLLRKSDELWLLQFNAKNCGNRMGVLATFLKALNLSEQWKLPHIVALQDSGCDNFSWNHLSSAGYGLWNQHLIHADMTMAGQHVTHPRAVATLPSSSTIR